MAHQWFRLYAEFATDHKVQMMSEADQRRFVMLLCMRCGNDGVTLHDTEVAFHLRISNEEWASTKGVFLAKNLINEDNSPTAWDKRQFRSDSSAERVARHRAKAKKACNVTVTPPDTDTDTEVNPTVAAPSGFAEFWLAYPRKDGKGAAEKAYRKAKIGKALLPVVLQAIERARETEQWRKDGGQFIPHPSTWLSQRRWEDGDVPKNGSRSTLFDGAI